jgi:DNA (cytosine-5)-methyltransferase 1
MSGLFNRQPIYNELDAHACAWLRRLVTAGSISRGQVVEQDIRELDAERTGQARHFHAFAGIGLWDYALRLAGWPAELAVWTGSCPCQPFSVAGRGAGTSDERHLWPAWFRLIRECSPPVVLGEQVASPAGRVWFDAVSADLEALGYAVGAADLCAAGVGAPHLRQRLYFVAHHQELGRRERNSLRRWGAKGVRAERNGQRSADNGSDGVLAEPNGGGWGQEGIGGNGRAVDAGAYPVSPAAIADASTAGIMGDAGSTGGGRDGRAVSDAQGEGRRSVQAVRCVTDELELAGYTRGFWADADWLICRDGKARPIEPGTFPLAHGRSGRVAVVRTGEQAGAETQEAHWYNRTGALKCIGNAIVPQVAAVFIEAALRSIYDEFV